MGYNIIGFAGRLASGKTELSNICEQYGYTKLYFALPLKTLCANLLNISIEELNVLKRNNHNIDYFITEECVNEIHKKTDISFDDINKTIGGKIIKNVREMLQIIGTDVIRKFNSNWHVEQIKNMISPNVTYVIDDVRFPNEKKMIDEMGGVCWYIIRPTMKNISNHESETALEWRQFDNIIVNNNSLQYLKYHWEVFMSKGHDNSLEIRRDIYQKLLGNDEITSKLQNIMNEEHNIFTLQDAFFIHPDEFKYTPKFINNDDIKHIEEKEQYVWVTYKNETHETVSNCFQIEDLKKYI